MTFLRPVRSIDGARDPNQSRAPLCRRRASQPSIAVVRRVPLSRPSSACEVTRQDGDEGLVGAGGEGGERRGGREEGGGFLVEYTGFLEVPL